MSALQPTRRDVLVAAAASPLLTTLACETQRATPSKLVARPRHVIVFVADDNSRIDLGCYGNRDCHTPNIDALAAQGMRFRCGYTPVGICKPARAALYTGLYPTKNGATGFTPIRADVATWTELLTPDVCATGMIGKLNVEPLEKFRFEKWERPREVGGARDTAELAAAFGGMLDTFRERRMALVVNLKDPHRPFRAPYDTPECQPTPVPHDPTKLSVPPSLYDTPATRKELALYYDAIWRLDCSVGRLLAELDARGLRDDTLVLLTSDNGQPFPFAKTTLYECGINLPFIARWPRALAAGGVSDALVSLIDILPTALDAFEIDAAGTLDGRSLLPLLRGETRGVRDAIVGQHTAGRVGAPTPSRSLRTARPMMSVPPA